ncbi:caspase recruitment domain-containing protein 14 [Amia ocellicauda]|uniref:caspase recruitment domain-containing protein 14 n=1 Tax=Amia ocellicauda TaxID=2972642 RepID=UPI003464092E
MSGSVSKSTELQELDEDELWGLIEDHRHPLSLGVQPCLLIPFLRQARMLDELDEDEILHSLQLTHRCMKTSRMLDLLRTRGRDGAMAFLDSLMIHYPKLYSQVTGLTPSSHNTGFSGLMKTSELTEYLVRAITGMQEQMCAARAEAGALEARCSKLEGELAQAQRRSEAQRGLEAEHARLRREFASMHQSLLQLKDEKMDLHTRYSAALEESAVVSARCRDLQLELYRLQFELRKAHTETDFEKRHSLRVQNSVDTRQLREEIITLRRKLLQAETFSPAREDILERDLEEALDSRGELVDQISSLQEECERLVSEREELLEEKESLALQVEKLSLDCEMYQQKTTVMQGQLRELQNERDQAYLSRDEAQTQIAKSLSEKDALRLQLVELQDKLFSLRTHVAKNSMDREEERDWTGAECRASCSTALPSIELPSGAQPHRPRLCRMAAICPDTLRSHSQEEGAETCNSFRSNCAEPPSMVSLRRREEDLQRSTERSDSKLGIWDPLPSPLDGDGDFVFVLEEPELSAPQPPLPPPDCSPSNGVFLVRSRPRARRNGSRVMTISFQGEALLSQLQVLGGNNTGVFVHCVTEGSAAQSVGISPGAQILEVQCEREHQSFRAVLEEATLEEALWALQQVRGFCCLSLRSNQDGYEKLLSGLRSGELTSGDSFYVRVNVSLPGDGGRGGRLAVRCDDVVHVMDTRYGSDGTWRACRTHHYQLKDLESGTLPNYYRAQRMLIRAIEDMAFQHLPCRRVDRSPTPGKQKAVRIISTSQQLHSPLWTCSDSSTTDNPQTSHDPGGSAVSGNITLMPYTLVNPHRPPAPRPVLLLPTVFGRLMNNRLAELQGFQKCVPEVLSDSEYALRLQRGEVLEECDLSPQRCFTQQAVETVMAQGHHCVLPLGVDSVRRLHSKEIYPIVIFTVLSDRSIRKLRNKLQRQGSTEDELLECSRIEEPKLDRLPCLYSTVVPETWGDSAALLAQLRSTVLEEQSKIVWVEQDLLR